MRKRVYLFDEGSKDDKELLGSKGANLCEMTSMELPVPFGFIITTATCHEFYKIGKHLPNGLVKEYKTSLKIVEEKMGRSFGDPHNPLLLSVRSGAPISMPGMMDTVLNLGLNDKIVEGLAAKTNNPRFAYDSYRRFIQMFGSVVLKVKESMFEYILSDYKKSKSYQDDMEMNAEDWKNIVKHYQNIVTVPNDPFVQLEMAIQAVFLSWYTPRAIVYREMNHIPENLGTAVNVQAMVFGNYGSDSGAGVAFTRNPATGEKVFYGEFLVNAAGEDVVAGTRTPIPIEQLRQSMPEIYHQLYGIQEKLEKHYKDMQDLEFTIQEGKLYMLQTRSGKRTGRAAVKIAVDMVQESLINEKEALLRVEPEHIDSFLHNMIDPTASKEVIATGLPASPGGVSGKVVFSEEIAVKLAEAGESIILVRHETTPEDIQGMKIASGILTQLGGMTSHAAVVARGMGICAVTGCSEISIDYDQEIFTTQDNRVVHHLDVITLDGSSGEVMIGDVSKIAASSSADFQTLLAWSDKYRQLGVRANADTPRDAMKAREMGAEGIGLCRTEHMFFDANRIDVMRAMILAESQNERQSFLNQLFEFQKEDMKALFEVMGGLPVTIRLIDPPLHEFLPKTQEEMKELSKRIRIGYDTIEKQVDHLHEVNPMLGFRGCRLSIVYPEITKMQVQAIITAALEVESEGTKVIPEIMIPLVVNVQEIRTITKGIDQAIKDILQSRDVSLTYRIGTMMETPRACLIANQITPEVEFMSFGTNDLTQMTFGFSRDDIGKFLPSYLKHKILDQDPFVSLDYLGVGGLMKKAIKDSRRQKRDIKYGICGEHGGDPRSIQFCHNLGLDYVSCSPYRIPTARVAAAQAALSTK